MEGGQYDIIFFKKGTEVEIWEIISHNWYGICGVHHIPRFLRSLE